MASFPPQPCQLDRRSNAGHHCCSRPAATQQTSDDDRYVHGRLARGTKAQQQYMKELYESIGIIDPNINGGLRALFRVESVPISNELEA